MAGPMGEGHLRAPFAPPPDNTSDRTPGTDNLSQAQVFVKVIKLTV